MNAEQRKARREERKATPNALHSAKKVRYGTPSKVLAIAHEVFRDGVSLDPFSEPAFNARVKASRILTGERGADGYADRWIDDEACPRADHLLHDYPVSIRDNRPPFYTALVNPPGSRDGENVKNGWKLLDTYHWLGWLNGGAFWIAFNLNSFQTTQGVSHRSMLSPEFIRCIPSSRERFVDEDGIEEDQPTHPMAFVLLPSTDVAVGRSQRDTFRRLASALGEVF